MFGGDSPFITTDGSNPTSPVLSGSPRFSGEIAGSFVDEDGNPTTVTSFSFDAGYFDALASTRLTWFDPNNVALGQQVNSALMIIRLEAEGGNIASFRIGIFENEPAGYAIDNFVSERSTFSILFREKSGDAKDGTWGFLDDEIPGFDHVAFNYDSDVYESHPGYATATYQSSDGEETIAVTTQNGVQQSFTKDTFAHNSVDSSTKVVNFQEIGISQDEADSMKAYIETQLGTAGFQVIDFSGLDGISKTLSPAAQKGGGNTFTCVGLIEKAAEEAGINDGQGFIPDSFENIGDFPLLSPELLYWTMQTRSFIGDAKQAILGFFDPIGFVITDPLGRRLGTFQGVRYTEIPNAYLTEEGSLQYVVIPFPIPGRYSLELTQVDGESGVAILAGQDGSILVPSVAEPAEGNSCKETGDVAVVVGSLGDYNEDGEITQADVDALQVAIPQFTVGFGNPGDLNGDGVLDNDDVGILQTYVDAVDVDAESSCPEYVPDGGLPSCFDFGNLFSIIRLIAQVVIGWFLNLVFDFNFCTF